MTIRHCLSVGCVPLVAGVHTTSKYMSILPSSLEHVQERFQVIVERSVFPQSQLHKMGRFCASQTLASLSTECSIPEPFLIC